MGLRTRRGLRGATLGLLGAALAAWAPPASAQERTFGIYGGSVEELLDAGDAHVRGLYSDARVTRQPLRIQRGEGNPFEEVRGSAAWSVPRTVPVPWGRPGETRVEDVQVVSVNVAVYRPVAAAPPAPVATAPALDAELRKRAWESFDGMWRDDVQWKATVVAKLVPEAGAPPASYHFYALGDRLELLAGNVRLTVAAAGAQSYLYAARPELRALAEAILARLPGGAAAAGSLTIRPVMSGASETVGLIPASERFPARIAWSGARAGDEVRFALEAGAPGELRGDGRAGREIAVRAGATGEAIAQYHYLPAGKPLDRPLRLRVTATGGGTTLAGEIHVGLGLAFDRLVAAKGQTYADDTHALSLTVKSGFHPGLDLHDWLTRAGIAKVWPDSVLGLRLYAEWMNRPEGAAFDDAFRGTVSLVPGADRQVLLVAQNAPWYEAPGGKFFYPAIQMRSSGAHAYRLSARGAVLGGHGSFIDFLHEAMVQGESFVVVSKEDPEAWYQSLACSLNARTETQYLMLEAVKLIPAYGAIADRATAVSGLVCGLLAGDVEKSVMDLASWLGAQYVDNLMEPQVFDKLTLLQQDAVLAAKAATTGGTDNVKRRQDLDALRRSAP